MMAETFNIVEPIEIWQRLQIAFVLDKLFSAAMEQADGSGALNHLRKAKAEERARRKRMAERKAKQLAAERVKHPRVEPEERSQGPVMASGAPWPGDTVGSART
jgi:hypothetical protein